MIIMGGVGTAIGSLYTTPPNKIYLPISTKYS